MKARRREGLILVVATAALASGSCGTSASRRTESAPPTLSITPAAQTANVPISAEIGTKVAGGTIGEVALTDSTGVTMGGLFRADGSAWVPDQALRYGESYTVRVTASNGTKTATQSSRFTTMPKPRHETLTTLNVADGETYGVAMPVTIGFDPAVPKATRDDVERRLFVVTDPPQPGAWHWLDDGSQVSYRAPDYWRPGTRISVRSALAGLPMDADRSGDADHIATATIGGKVTISIDNATKQMSVFTNDTLARKMPVSLGKPSTPTSSGHMVIMEKFETTVFDTTGSADPYVVTVQDAQRLTNGGEFIHSAPWSVGQQGVVNTSHGCTNLSPEDARWLMGVTHIGDPVTITGTEVTLDQGNGWTAWNISWDEFVKGSTLPEPARLKVPQPAIAPPAAGAAPTARASNNGR